MQYIAFPAVFVYLYRLLSAVAGSTEHLRTSTTFINVRRTIRVSFRCTRLPLNIIVDAIGLELGRMYTMPDQGRAWSGEWSGQPNSV